LAVFEDFSGGDVIVKVTLALVAVEDRLFVAAETLPRVCLTVLDTAEDFLSAVVVVVGLIPLLMPQILSTTRNLRRGETLT
jgi:hypothetical protein